MRQSQPQVGNGAAVPNAIHYTALARGALLGIPLREARLGTVQALLLRAEEILQQVNRDNTAAMNNSRWNNFHSMNSTAASLSYVSPTQGHISQRTPQLPQHASTPVDEVDPNIGSENPASQPLLNRTFTVNTSNRVNPQPLGGGCCQGGGSCQPQHPTYAIPQRHRQAFITQRGLPAEPYPPYGNSIFGSTLDVYPDQSTPFTNPTQNYYYHPFVTGRRTPAIIGATVGPPPDCGVPTPTSRPHTSPPPPATNGMVDLITPTSEIRNVSNLSQGSILTCPYCNQELEVDINVDVLANDSTYSGQTEADLNVRVEFPTAETVGSNNNELRCPHCRRIIEMRLNVRTNTDAQDHNSFTVRLDLVQQGAPPNLHAPPLAAASTPASSVEHVFRLAAAGDSSRSPFSGFSGCQERPGSKRQK